MYEHKKILKKHARNKDVFRVRLYVLNKEHILRELFQNDHIIVTDRFATFERKYV